MNCPQCHSPVLSGALSCAQCGAKLDGDMDVELSVDNESRSQYVAKLDGDMAPVSAEPAHLCIDRSPDNDICLNDDMVSRYHALLFQQADGSWRLEEPVFKKECCPMKALLRILLVCLVLANAGCATTSRTQSESDTAVSINNQGCDYDRSGDYYNAYLNFKKSADMGYSLAKYNLAVLYWNGRYVQKDPHTAGRYFLEAAQAGLPEAMYRYGLYLWNYGIKQPNDPAVSWIQAAASRGSTNAANFLQWLMNADSITQMGYNYWQIGDYYSAYVNYKKAADMGYYRAKYNLGLLYWNGWYVQQDPHTAGRYWLEAAQAGFLEAMTNYGLYLFTYGNTQDQQTAVSWIQTAASHGDKNASMLLQNLPNGQLLNNTHQAYQAAQQTKQNTVSAPAPSNAGRRKQRHHAEPSSPPSYMSSKRSDNAGSKNAPSVQDVEKF